MKRCIGRKNEIRCDNESTKTSNYCQNCLDNRPSQQKKNTSKEYVGFFIGFIRINTPVI